MEDIVKVCRKVTDMCIMTSMLRIDSSYRGLICWLIVTGTREVGSYQPDVFEALHCKKTDGTAM